MTGARLPSRGFTLIELLVTIGIVALLAGILLPVLARAMSSGRDARVRADFQTIAVALQAYRSDFNDFPRPGATEVNTGFATLTKALIGPGGTSLGELTTPDGDGVGTVRMVTTTPWLAIGPAPIQMPPSAANGWLTYDPRDGVPGPGFRARASARTTSPYVQPDAFQLRGMAMLDAYGHPILYFPANPVPPNLRQTSASVTEPFVGNTTVARSLYFAGHNLATFRNNTGTTDAVALRRMRAALGDLNHNGRIDAGEEPATTGPYLLWSAGADGQYGATEITDGASPATVDATLRAALRNVDDVTNFD